MTRARLLRLVDWLYLWAGFNRRYKNIAERSARFNVPPPDKDSLWAVLKHCFIGEFRCCYCGCQLVTHQKHPNLQAFSFDHDIPLTSGGDNSTTNIVVCCHRCNIIKGTMDGSNFRELVQSLSEEQRLAMFNEWFRGRLANKIRRVEEENR